MDKLIQQGVAKDHIIYINKELYEFDAIRSYHDLHRYVDLKTIRDGKTCYLLIDEIQEIEAWERALNSLFASNKYDIFITGSNARLLSSELASLLSGRYIEFRMGTFIFKEYLQIADMNRLAEDNIDHFTDFMRFGGFPGIHFFNRDETAIRQYITSVYSTIFLKDIVMRYNIRDVSLLEKISVYLADNCGNITSSKSISDFLKSQHLKISVDTVQNYIRYCVDAMLVEKVQRFDIKGKRILETLEKYFFNDVGIKNAITGYLPEYLPGILENMVMLEMKANGYQVHVGKQLDKEVDLIASKGNDKIYIQICTTLNDARVIDREYGALESINDHFPKYVLSLDKGFETSRKGIRWMNIKEFLLLESRFLSDGN
jgi:predicted AAA+ superfamily ATPase